MKINQKIIIFALVIIVSCLTIIGMYINEYIYLNRQYLVMKNEDKILKTKNLSLLLENKSGSGIYVESSSSTWPGSGYVFNSTLSKCENGGTLTYDEVNKKVLLSNNVSDKCYVYFDLEVISNFADYIRSIYVNNDSGQTLLYHDGTMSNGINDGSLRYSGANPDNYVCFGSADATCPADNVYRIIGLFENSIKLIKNTSIGKMAWDEMGTNDWGMSSLFSYLNETFLFSLDIDMATKIADTTWIASGGSLETLNQVIPKNAYETEIFMPEQYNLIDAPIGLMYASDYGFAASQDNWNISLDYTRNNNWLNNGIDEWIITFYLFTSRNVYLATSYGSLSYDNSTVEYGVRPTFYLASDVSLISGTGTFADPYRI